MLSDPRKRAALTLAAAVALLLAATLVGGWQLNAAPAVKAPQGCGNCQGNNGNGGGNGSGGGVPGKALTASVVGVTPVAPGHDGTITVRVDNPNSQPVVVTRVAGAVTSVTPAQRRATLPTCSAAWFGIDPYLGSRVIAANSTDTLSMRASFTDRGDTNQDNCKDVSYHFSFTVHGQQS